MLTDRCCQIANFQLTKSSSIGNLFPLEEFLSSCALEESLELLGETFWFLLFHVFQDYLFRAWWTVDAIRNESILSGVVYLVFDFGWREDSHSRFCHEFLVADQEFSTTFCNYPRLFVIMAMQIASHTRCALSVCVHTTRSAHEIKCSSHDARTEKSSKDAQCLHFFP